MEHLIIGLIVGIVMGLTGAGGALISIPLFLTLLNTTVKEATVLSLLAVMLGTIVNLFGQENKPDKKIVLPFVIFGAIANYASLPLKKLLPDIGIAGLLILIGAYSLWSIWKKMIVENDEKVVESGLWKSSLIGSGLGVITTLTGLGGGVLLVPILKNFYGKSYTQALPISLLTIFLVSGISFITQIKVGLKLISVQEIGFLAIGALVAFYLLKVSLRKIKKEKLETIRKVVFSLVTVYSVISVILKSL